jgi:hypothetical protein
MILSHLGFEQDWDKAPNGDMVRGNWRISPERSYAKARSCLVTDA